MPAAPPSKETPHPVFDLLVTGHFREGRGYRTWREAGTDDWLLIYTLSGGGRFGYPGGALVTGEGDIILLRPGARHDYRTAPEAGRWDLLWAHFHPRPHWHEWLAWPERAPGLMRLTPGEPAVLEKVAGRLFDVHHRATGALRHRELFAMNALEEVLLWCDTQNPRSEQARMDGRVRDAVDFLCRHFHEKIPLDRLAEVSGLSVSRLAHLFRAQVGTTPQQFLERQRLERAKQLLDLTPRPVGEIAAEVGFDNPFYFTLRFKRHTGFSPRDYRRRATPP